MTASRARSLVALCAALLFAACIEPATEVVVVIATDLPRDVPLMIYVTVQRGLPPISPTTTAQHGWTRVVVPNDAGFAANDAGITLPATFAIVPPVGAGDGDPMTLRVEGHTPYDTIRQTVVFPFTRNVATTLFVNLDARCLLATTGCTASDPCTMQALCEERGETCGNDGRCVSMMMTPVRDAGTIDVGCVAYCSHAACGAPDGCGGVCSGPCATGEACLAGVCQCATGYSQCGPSCLPTSGIECAIGASMMRACGMCGTQTEDCMPDCTWGGWSGCDGEGTCAPGTMMSRSCGNCGTQTTTCTATCQPGTMWSGCMGTGCTPGSTQRGGCDQCEHQTCSAACTWGACTLNAGAACTWVSGTHSRACGACAGGQQYCLPSCVWSTGCVSFCGGTDCGSCLGSCAGGC